MKKKKNSKMWIPTTKFQKSVSWSFQFRSNVIEHNGQKRNIGSAKKIQVQLVDAWLCLYLCPTVWLFQPSFNPAIPKLPGKSKVQLAFKMPHFRAKLKYVLLLLHSAIPRKSHLVTSLNYTFFQIFAPCVPWG